MGKQLQIFLLLCSLAYSYFIPPILFGNTIKDIYGDSLADVTMMASQWSLYELKSDDKRATYLYGEAMIGGSNIFRDYLTGEFMRNYTGLPQHTAIYFDITFRLKNDWVNAFTNYIYIDIDDNTYYKACHFVKFSPTDSIWSNYGEYQAIGPHIVGKIPHSKSSVKLRFPLQSGWGWFAIKDISLSLRNDSSVTQSNNLILVTLAGTTILESADTKTNCSTGYYTSAQTCISCHFACQNCFGPLASQCYSCRPTYSLIGNECLQCPANCQMCSGVELGKCQLCNPGFTLDFDGTCNPSNTCKASSYVIKRNSDIPAQGSLSYSFCTQPCPSGAFMLWNYTCASSCNPPLKPIISNGAWLCTFPCNISNKEYLYANGRCLSSCSYDARNENDYLFCGGCSDYLYQNGSCLSTCSAPYYISNQNMIKTCNNSCSVDQYLYPNGSCLSFCPQFYKMRVEGSYKFCWYPCDAGQYLYSNGSCSSNCQTNFFVTKEGNDSFCNYPCPIGSYLYDNGTCSWTCQTNFTPIGQGLYQFCRFPCTSGKYLYSNGSCLSYCGAGYIPRTEGNMSLCDAIPSNITTNSTNNNTNTNTNTTQNNGCMDKSLYRYQNGSCLQTCSTPWVPVSQNGSYFCNSPCPSGYYFYQHNNSCSLTCGLGYTSNTEGNITFCFELPQGPPTNSCYIYYAEFPNNLMVTTCSNHNNGCGYGRFLYQNGTCSELCTSPYFGVLRQGSAYCESSCTSDQFLYPNGSCSSECRAEFIRGQENNFRFCDYRNNYTDNTNHTTNDTNTTNNTYGCIGSLYKYENSSCLPSCPSPYSFIWNNGSAFCNRPCPIGYYLYPNGLCLTTCVYGYTPTIQQDILFCAVNNTSNNSTSNTTNPTNNTQPYPNNTASVALNIYIRYNISLNNFTSQDGLNKFIQQLASILGVDPSYIVIIDVREGSTIIESQVIISSPSDADSMDAAAGLAQTMQEKFVTAIKNNNLNIINGANILDYKPSIQILKTSTGSKEIEASNASSSDAIIIGLGVGLGALGLIIGGFVIYRCYQKRKTKTMIRTNQVAREEKYLAQTQTQTQLQMQRPVQAEAEAQEQEQGNFDQAEKRGREMRISMEKEYAPPISELQGVNHLQDININMYEKNVGQEQEQEQEQEMRIEIIEEPNMNMETKELSFIKEIKETKEEFFETTSLFAGLGIIGENTRKDEKEERTDNEEQVLSLEALLRQNM